MKTLQILKSTMYRAMLSIFMIIFFAMVSYLLNVIETKVQVGPTCMPRLWEPSRSRPTQANC